jgi:hypothetical protein
MQYYCQPICENQDKEYKKMLMQRFIINEEDAIADFSSSLLVALTNIMCAFFSKPLFVASKRVVIVKNNAHVPISALLNCLISTIKFTNPKTNREHR